MDTILKNAIASIQLGVEDFQSGVARLTPVVPVPNYSSSDFGKVEAVSPIGVIRMRRPDRTCVVRPTELSS